MGDYRKVGRGIVDPEMGRALFGGSRRAFDEMEDHGCRPTEMVHHQVHEEDSSADCSCCRKTAMAFQVADS